MPAADLLAFLQASPSPGHTVAEMRRRLEAAGFTALDERTRWALSPGDQHYAIRDGTSVVAFRVGHAPPTQAGFRLVGAHTDSPTLRLRPLPETTRTGYRLVGVEPYGGVLLHTWLDRDLTLAGRVAVRGAGGAVETRLIQLDGAPLRIPSLAIHLFREIREEGLRLDPQRHVVPLLGLEGDAEPALLALVAATAGVDRDDILGHDLVTADTQAPRLGGAADRWIFAARLDNLLSCHAGLLALTEAAPAVHTQVLIANDHEEVGSASAEGAAGSFLADTLARIVAAVEEGDAQALPIALARSALVSADGAHAVHPNYAERHEPSHQPRLGAGPVVKTNANQSYATDAVSAAWFIAGCRDSGVPVQHFVTRADLPCGSTIGPITATRLGLATVDVGAPMLSMHSCREQAAVEDVALLARALQSHLEHPEGETR